MGISAEIVPFRTGRNDRLKPGKLLNLIGHIRNETRQFSMSLLLYSGSSICLNAGSFIDSPGITHFSGMIFWYIC